MTISTPNRLKVLAVMALAVTSLFGGFAGSGAADINIGSSASGTGNVTANLNALVSLTISTSTIAFGGITTSAGADTTQDSRDTSSSTMGVSNVNSNVNVGAYFRRDNFVSHAYAVGTTTSATLTNLDYATSTLTNTPKAGQAFNSTTGAYGSWTASSANDPDLWIFFDDTNEAGLANLQNDFSQSSGASTANNAGNFTPYLIEFDSANHTTGVPATNGAMPTQKWTDASSVTTSDIVMEGSVVYYVEAGSPTAGNQGSLSEKFVQVVLKASGDEIMCRQGGASTAGANWSALSGFDIASSYSGLLNSTFKAPDTTCSLFGNRYTPSLTVSTGTKRIVLSLANQLPLTIGGATTTSLYAALAFPKEAPRLDYSWTGTLNGINWSPIDALASTADNVQYP